MIALIGVFAYGDCNLNYRRLWVFFQKGVISLVLAWYVTC
jgi:hypothetical protein